MVFDVGLAYKEGGVGEVEGVVPYKVGSGTFIGKMSIYNHFCSI